MKKRFLVLLSVWLTMALLTACSSTPNTDTPALATNTVTIETEEPQATETVEKAAITESVTGNSGSETQPLAEDEIIVSTITELQAAMANTEITIIHIGADMDISSELTIERDDDLSVYIEKDTTLTVSDSFTLVGCAIQNDGTMLINGTFNRGISNLTNNGTLAVKSGGKISSGMSNTENHGTFTVDDNGELFIEKGSIFNNFGALANNGYVSINDGGQLNDEGGTIVNDGTIDLVSFFNGDITLITGTGILNDNRE